MDYDSQTDAFRFDLDSMVERYLEEFDINSITIIGALQEKVYELSQGGTILFEMDSDFWEFDFDDEQDSDDYIEEDI